VIIEWLAPVSAFICSAQLLGQTVRLGWRDWENWPRLIGTAVLGYLLVGMGFGATSSLVGSIVVSSLLLTLAFIPPRFVLRLIKAKRPNEIEDPELFENGELKPEARDKLLAERSQENEP
jgi:small-conductance mechanosensitive channel